MEGLDKELSASCICPRCHSYNDCAKGLGEVLYCMKGKSPSCIRKDKGCICQSCLVYFRKKLRGTAYCTKSTPAAP